MPINDRPYVFKNDKGAWTVCTWVDHHLCCIDHPTFTRAIDWADRIARIQTAYRQYRHSLESSRSSQEH